MTQDLQRVRASVFGALIGDAAGATLEFLGRKPTEAEVDAALKLPGGGYWKLNPGQITDDGELMISLARALVRSQQQFSIAEIASGYSGWPGSITKIAAASRNCREYKTCDLFALLDVYKIRLRCSSSS